jgi:hypothetical protein
MKTFRAIYNAISISIYRYVNRRTRAFNWLVYSEVTMRQEKTTKLDWDKQGFMQLSQPGFVTS